MKASLIVVFIYLFLGGCSYRSLRRHSNVLATGSSVLYRYELCVAKANTVNNNRRPELKPKTILLYVNNVVSTCIVYWRLFVRNSTAVVNYVNETGNYSFAEREI